MASGNQAAMAGEGRLASGRAINATPTKPQHKPSRRRVLKRSMPSASASGNDSSGMVEIRIDMTPPGKWATAIKNVELGTIVPMQAMTKVKRRPASVMAKLLRRSTLTSPSSSTPMVHCQKISPKCW